MMLSVLFLWQNAFCQDKNGGILSNPNYLSNPINYLSKINEDLLSTNILIDKAFYSDLILNCNGVDKVTVINSGDWSNFQNDLLFSMNDKSHMMDLNVLWDKVTRYNIGKHLVPIGIIDFNFDRLNPDALIKGTLVEGDEFLEVNSRTSEIILQHRLVAASTLQTNIPGDVINFILPSELFFTNIYNHNLESIEIDFGNGQGFQLVNFNEPISVKYRTNESDFIELVTKLTYLDRDRNQNIVYSRSTVHRTGSATIPMLEEKEAGLRADAPTNVFIDGLPAGCKVGTNDVSNCDISYVIVYALHEEAGFDPNGQKLRRPFIVADGFDPGNRRDYFQTVITGDPEDFEDDSRGLYQIMNGDPSPWEPEESANMCEQLTNEGYDLIFVNYKKGAGDIPTNGNWIIDFFNTINSSTFRDNKTEEAILVGPSMSGMTTRFALKAMENSGINHYVKSWVAFDAPMKGASVPLSMQHTVDFLTTINAPSYISSLVKLKANSIESQTKLRSLTAQQLLLAHFDFTNRSANLENPSILHSQFYTMINALGYPSYLKRYAISNGGTEKLYEFDLTVAPFYTQPPNWFGNNTIAADIDASFNNLRFTPKYLGGAPLPWLNGHGYSHQNDFSNSKHKIFKGSKQGALNDDLVEVKKHIGVDNCPGGYITPLASINAVSGNWYSKPIIPANDQWMKSTFMPTVSVLGITPTKDNIYDDWEDYQPSDTPFDDFFGQDGRNEEHVNVSIYTRNKIFDDYLHPDFTNSTRPYRRSGQTLNKSVDGPVAYTFMDLITFGGDGNSFTFENGADVNITSGETIKLEPGFLIKQGAKVNMRIDNSIDFPTVFRENNIDNAVDPSKISDYHRNKYDYSMKDVVNEDLAQNEIILYPNPASNVLNIEIAEKGIYDIEIYNTLGVLVTAISTDGNQILKVSITDFAKGVYFVKIKKDEIQLKNMEFIKF